MNITLTTLPALEAGWTWLRALRSAANASASPDQPARSAAEDAAAVRALADSVRHSDPSYASDLYAAADRHEREHGCADSLTGERTPSLLSGQC